MIFLSPSRKGRKGCAQQITDNAYSFFDKNKKTPCSDDFSLAKPQRTQRLRAANHGQRVFHSNKNNKNPCRDARAAPSVSFWYRRASKQASASRHQEETAFVPQACITARKTIKTADAAGIAVPAYDPYLHHTATSCKDNTCNTLIINYWCPLNRYNDLWNPFGLKESRSKHYATSPSFNFVNFQEGLPKPSPMLPPNPFPGVPSIHERPKEAGGRRFGDLEMDTIVGKNNKGAIVTIIDRSTDWLVMRKTAPWQRCK